MCSSKYCVLSITIITFTVIILYYALKPPCLPKYDEETWWGPMDLKDINDTEVRPFKVEFTDEMIQDLRDRLKNHRPFTPPLEGVGFQYGFNADELNSWLEYWADEYPFSKREEYINKYPHFMTNIQGLNVHFIRIRPKAPPGMKVVPLLMLQGWPTSVLELYDTFPIITSVVKDRDFAIEVIAADLPGFGFSEGPVRPNMGAVETAVFFRNFMHRLGFKQYYLHGGDWGAFITSNIATLFPEEVLGYHTSLPISLSKPAIILTLFGGVFPLGNKGLTERMHPLRDYLSWFIAETGYMHVQASKPDSIGVALTDSPSGLLSYVLQIISSGSKREYPLSQDGGLLNHFTRNQLIDNVMIYWVSNCITTSMRLYAEMLNKRAFGINLHEIPTPVLTWALQARHEIIYQPPYILKIKFPNLINATMLANGGHFLAIEQPEVLAEDVLTAMTAFIKLNKKMDRNEL